MWCAVANTKWGKIPGKASKGLCYFPYGGKEHSTEDFVKIRRTKFSKTNVGTTSQGNQTDGHGNLWCAVANTPHGKIPGKASKGTCWYSYNGGEHLTQDFEYVLD